MTEVRGATVVSIAPRPAIESAPMSVPAPVLLPDSLPLAVPSPLEERIEQQPDVTPSTGCL